MIILLYIKLSIIVKMPRCLLTNTFVSSRIICPYYWQLHFSNVLIIDSPHFLFTPAGLKSQTLRPQNTRQKDRKKCFFCINYRVLFDKNSLAPIINISLRDPHSPRPPSLRKLSIIRRWVYFTFEVSYVQRTCIHTYTYWSNYTSLFPISAFIHTSGRSDANINICSETLLWPISKYENSILHFETE